ncbi:MAG: AraC family transcriptional regulator [Nitrolancea sp.]
MRGSGKLVAMFSNGKRSSGVGLERSCGEFPGDWLRSEGPEDGVELLEAWFGGPAYRKHRHDTYAICLTTSGVQAFGYQGKREISLPGQVVVLHPDELHDGFPATDTGFGYRQLYVEPALIFDAVRTLRGVGTLPFARNPVATNAKLAEAISSAFVDDREPLAMDTLLLQLAEGLLEVAPESTRDSAPRNVDVEAVQRARDFLDVETPRVVHSAELEAITGLSRFELARQFRLICGTSPYRYSLMRRLDAAREGITTGRALSDVAFDAGFADQAHFSRKFSAAFGLTPAHYRSLR